MGEPGGEGDALWVRRPKRGASIAEGVHERCVLPGLWVSMDNSHPGVLVPVLRFGNGYGDGHIVRLDRGGIDTLRAALDHLDEWPARYAYRP